MSRLEACQFRAWRPWHAYDPQDASELTRRSHPAVATLGGDRLGAL